MFRRMTAPFGAHMKIALLLSESEERRRLADWLGAEHEVLPSKATLPAEVDLCVVECATLGRLRKVLRERRAGAGALPVLCLVRAGDEGAGARDLGDTVDDLLAAGAARDEVRARVAVLGRLREATRAAAASAATAVEQTGELRALKDQRDDLLRAVSHDLRTPLAIIHLQSQLLGEVLEKAGLSDRSVTRSLEAILLAARRMSAMIEDLVDLSRYQRGQLKLEKRTVDVGAFLTDLLDRSAPLRHGPHGLVEVAPGTPRVAADENRLERILLNLITNALKHAPTDHRARLRAAAQGREVLIGVADSASPAGAEPLTAVQERLTDDALLARQIEGLGAGLLITAALVDAHGGRIWCERTSPKGPAAFYFTLPAART
jgi:signal transduction histidine kinase